MQIPAYCPTCEKFYPGIAMDFGETPNVVFQNNVTTCPYGHRALLSDVTISRGQLEILHKNNPEKIKKIVKIASAAEKGEIDPAIALEEIIAISPELSAALKSEAGPIKALALLTLILLLIASMSESLAKIVEAAKSVFSESDPVPNTVVNVHNDITVINKIAARNIRNSSVPNALTKEQIRKQKQMAKKKKKGKDKKSKKLRRQQAANK